MQLNVNIWLVQREDGEFWAVAQAGSDDGCLGWGKTEAQAVQNAMAEVFNPSRYGSPVYRERKDVEPDTLNLLPGVDSIHEGLDKAVEEGLSAWMVYRNTAGEITNGRYVEPLRVEDRRVGGGFQESYLIARDLTNEGNVKTFKVSGIETLQVMS